MAITFKYELLSAKAASLNGMPNVIKEVTFSIVASDGVNQTSSFFPVELNDPEAGQFNKYEDLTREQIAMWVVEKLGDDRINSIKNGLRSRLAKMSEQPASLMLQEIKLPSN